MPGETTIEVEPIYGTHTKRGMVRLRVGDQAVHMPVAKAREIGAWMLDAATAAESDAAFMAIMHETGMSPEEQAQMLGKFRTHRRGIQESESQADRQTLPVAIVAAEAAGGVAAGAGKRGDGGAGGDGGGTP